MKDEFSAQRIAVYPKEKSISTFHSSLNFLDLHRSKQRIIPKDAHIHYNASLRNGRHPRSFKPVTEIWNYVNLAERRKDQVAAGERLWNVIETDRYYHTLDAVSKAETIVPETTKDEESQKQNKGDEILWKVSSDITRDNSNPVANAYNKKKGVDWKKRTNRLPIIERKIDEIISKRQIKEKTKAEEQGKKKGKASMKSQSSKYLSSLQDAEPQKEAIQTPSEVVFNKKQEAPVYYGTKAGLESSLRSSFLTINYTDGSVVLDNIKTTNRKNFVVFTFLDLHRPDSFRPLKYGDHVWLKICSGNGDIYWQNGSVLGSRIDQARVIGTVPLDPSIDNNDDGGQLDNEQVGIPIPIRASMPRNSDDTVDEKQARDNNQRARILGGWIIRCAKKDLEKQRGKDKTVYNLDEIYLEQDFSYISEAPQSIVSHTSICSEDLTSISEKSVATTEETRAASNNNDNNIETSYTQSSNIQQAPVVLRQLPGPRSQKEILQKHGLFIDRYAVFRIHIADIDGEIDSMTGDEKKNEIRMRKARLNLQNSTSNRNGKRIYDKHKSSTGDYEPIKGGENFPQEIRACMTDIAFFAHADKGFARQVKKESKLHDYYQHAMKTRGDPLDLAVRYSSHFANDTNQKVNYGPCEPLSRSLFSETSSYSSPFNVVKEVRFKPPSEIPLNGIQLRNVALHSRVSAFRPGNRRTSSSSSDDQKISYDPSDSLSLSSTLATDSLLCPEDDEGSLINDSVVPLPGRRASEISFDSNESCLLCHSIDAFDICQVNQMVKKDIKRWKQLKAQNPLGFKMSNVSPVNTPRTPSTLRSACQSRRSSEVSNAEVDNVEVRQDDNSEKNRNNVSAKNVCHDTQVTKVRDEFMGIELNSKEDIEKEMKEVDDKLLKHIMHEERSKRLEEFQNLCKKMMSIQSNEYSVKHEQPSFDDISSQLQKEAFEVSSQEKKTLSANISNEQDHLVEDHTFQTEKAEQCKIEGGVAEDTNYLRKGVDFSQIIDEKLIFDQEGTLEKYFASNSAMMKEICLSLERLLISRVYPGIQEVLKGTKNNKKTFLLHELAFLKQVMENIEAPIPHEFILKLHNYVSEGFRLSTISFHDVLEPVRNLIKVLDKFLEILGCYCYDRKKK